MKIIIRADASAEIGSGHVMRCLALVQAWTDAGGEAIWLQAATTPAIKKRLGAKRASVVALTAAPGSMADAKQTITHGKKAGAAWIVADGYCFGRTWQKRIKRAGFRLLLLDDYGHAEHYHADLILNQNASANQRLYTKRDAATRLLLGTRYALLRREFSSWRNWQRTIPDRAVKVLVTLGGSDPENVTDLVLEALSPVPGLEIVVVVGGSNPHLRAIKTSARHQKSTTRVVVDATNMPELMAGADVAISAAGSTTWELAFLGLPALLIVVADNQAEIAKTLRRAGVSLSLGSSKTLTAEKISRTLSALLTDGGRRREMSQRARRLVDGDGAARVVTRLLAASLNLRRADATDCQLLWEWANDPAVRSASFTPETIPWETHQHWFQNKLNDPSSVIFMSSGADEKPLGQVRFEWGGTKVAEIGVSVDRLQRRTGVGSALIRRAVDELFATTRVAEVQARIKTANPASIRAFEKAGFARTDIITVRGHEAVRMKSTAQD